jgi:exosortase A
MIFEKTEPRAIIFPGISRSWLVRFSLLAAAFLYLYASTFPSLIADWWEDPNYSHGFLVPFLSAYFVWERRNKLYMTVIQPNSWGLMLLLGGFCLFFLGQVGAEFFLVRFSMIAVLSGLLLYLFGWELLKVLSFPIAFLIFMIPFPSVLLNSITFPLQLFAAKVSTFSLQMIDIPVFRDGNIIVLPYTTLEVAEACSGIRSLVSLTMLAVVFAYMTQQNIFKRSLLILSAIPIAIVTNAFRIWGTGILAHLYGMKLAEGFYHTFAGWLVFILAFGLLMAEGYALLLFKPSKQA